MVSTNIGIQIHLWELLPYINMRLLSSTFMTAVAVISHVTYRDNENAEQMLKMIQKKKKIIWIFGSFSKQKLKFINNLSNTFNEKN